MKRLASAMIAAAIVTAASAQAFAQCGWCDTECFREGRCHGGRCATSAFWRGYDENVRWPYQYVPTAARSVYQINEVMATNGWRRQNMLGSYHFDQKTNELTQAGELKLKWILTQAPASRRTVFVERGLNPNQTIDRIASVRDVASGQIADNGSLQVFDTHLVAEGHPAAYVDATFVGLQENRPPPVLPPSTGSTGSVTTD